VTKAAQLRVVKSNRVLVNLPLADLPSRVAARQGGFIVPQVLRDRHDTCAPDQTDHTVRVPREAVERDF